MLFTKYFSFQYLYMDSIKKSALIVAVAWLTGCNSPKINEQNTRISSELTETITAQSLQNAKDSFAIEFGKVTTYGDIHKPVTFHSWETKYILQAPIGEKRGFVKINGITYLVDGGEIHEELRKDGSIVFLASDESAELYRKLTPILKGKFRTMRGRWDGLLSNDPNIDKEVVKLSD